MSQRQLLKDLVAHAEDVDSARMSRLLHDAAAEIRRLQKMLREERRAHSNLLGEPRSRHAINR